MKKAFDQTVRDLKREVNKKVLKVPGIEQKVLDATSNEPWGPHGSNLADIAQATRNYNEYQIIMNVMWKRISDTGKNWRHVYKGLTVLEYLVAHGSERVIDEIKEHAYQISTLSNFQYIDSSGRDQGSNVRKKSQSLVNLVNDKERIQELRQKAQANREKYRSSFSTGRGGYGDRFDDDRYEGRNGRDEDRYGYGRDRESAYRDDDRYGRNGDSYGREGDRYSRDSDEKHGRDSYRDDDYRGNRGNDDYGSRNGSLHRDRSFDEDDRYSSRSGGGRIDDSQDERQFEHRLSASGGAPPTYEDATKDGQNLEQEDRDGGNYSGASPKASSVAGASPKASSAVGASPKASVAVPLHEVASPAAPSESTNTAPVTAADDVLAPASFETSGFDEFDPRGSLSAAAAPAARAATTLEMDLFGSSLDPLYSLALMPVDSTPANTDANVPASSSFGTDFADLQHGENPFGDPPFKAIPENFQAHQESFAPNTSFQPSILTGAPENLATAGRKLESTMSLDFGGSFGDLSYTSTASGGQQNLGANPAEVNWTPTNDDFTSLLAPQAGSAVFSPPMFQPTAPLHTARVPHQQPGPHVPFAPEMSQFAPQQPAAPMYSTGILPQQAGPQATFAPQVSQFTPQQATAPVHTAGIPQQTSLQSPFAPHLSQFTPQAASGTPLASQITTQAAYPTTNMQHPQMNLLSAAPVSTLPAKGSSNDKFETKSSVWADTLSRGLVNLNISGSKINPHADIGIDFESMNRKEKRTEDNKVSASPVTSTITMGKAMGSGSGMGRAGGSGLARPSNPMMGSGMGMGMVGNPGMGMVGNPGMGMGMGGNPGMGMGMGGNPSMGMGMGGNPGMGMGMGGNPGMGMGMGMGGNPGMGMGGYGGSMNQPMGMGMRMNMGMGMNMGMNQGGMPMRPPMGMSPGGPGMPGAGYNPMPGYGSQQPYGGGYQ